MRSRDSATRTLLEHPVRAYVACAPAQVRQVCSYLRREPAVFHTGARGFTGGTDPARVLLRVRACARMPATLVVRNASARERRCA